MDTRLNHLISRAKAIFSKSNIERNQDSGLEMEPHNITSHSNLLKVKHWSVYKILVSYSVYIILAESDQTSSIDIG